MNVQKLKEARVNVSPADIGTFEAQEIIIDADGKRGALGAFPAHSDNPSVSLPIPSSNGQTLP